MLTFAHIFRSCSQDSCVVVAVMATQNKKSKTKQNKKSKTKQNKMALDSAGMFLAVVEVALVTRAVLRRVFILIGDIEIEKTIKAFAVALLLILYILMLWAGALMYTEMSNTLLLSREERAPEDLGRRVLQADTLFNFLGILLVDLCTNKPRKHQPELNTSLINPASEHCVVVARARNCGSTTNIYCRNIDNSGSGVGKPFQLRRSENTSFWTNEDVENEGIKVGCVVEYRVLTCSDQSPLERYCKRGKRDGKQFIFHRNDRKPLLVSFH